jgi:hypothetical protein
MDLWKCRRLMREVLLIKTERAQKLHVTASSIQSHIWYHDDYVATLCGQWLQVHDMHTSRTSTT